MALVDYFLKIDGVEGESEDAKHKNEIHVLSFSFGASQAGSFATGGGGGSGKVQMQDFHFMMNINKASPKLLEKCATGEHIPNAVLTARKAGKDQQEYMTIKMSDLLVSSYQNNGQADANSLPTDSISMNFAKIEYEYKPQDAKGQLGAAVKMKYDLKQMKAG